VLRSLSLFLPLRNDAFAEGLQLVPTESVKGRLRLHAHTRSFHRPVPFLPPSLATSATPTAREQHRDCELTACAWWLIAEVEVPQRSICRRMFPVSQ
jgi:hypothetical protein